jgi:hypothetical protein
MENWISSWKTTDESWEIIQDWTKKKPEEIILDTTSTYIENIIECHIYEEITPIFSSEINKVLLNWNPFNIWNSISQEWEYSIEVEDIAWNKNNYTFKIKKENRKQELKKAEMLAEEIKNWWIWMQEWIRFVKHPPEWITHFI